jgi:hypothetical protein
LGYYRGLGSVAANVFTVWGQHRLPGGQPMLRCLTPIGDANDAYQIHKDITVTMSGSRPLKLRLSAWLRLPPDWVFAPTNQDFGLLLSWFQPGTTFPVGYYTANVDWSFSGIDDTSTDRLLPLHCELEIPATLEDVPVTSAIVHVAWCPPQGLSFLGGLTLRGDDGLFYIGIDPTVIAADAVTHAQDPLFLKDDRNIGSYRISAGDTTDRDFVYEDHAPILGTIQGLASEGWFDWGILYTYATRLMGFFAHHRGTRKPVAACRLSADGVGNVADIRRLRAWSSGASLVACQDRSANSGKHERAAQLDGAAAIEDVTVAARDAHDYDLASRAAERLDLLGHPETIEIDCLPGDDRLISTITLGDTFPVLCTKPGHSVDGDYRMVRRTYHPKSDTVTIVCNPVVA